MGEKPSPSRARKRRAPTKGQKRKTSLILRNLRKLPLAFVALGAAFALMISLGEALGSPLPTWAELYRMAGLSHMQGIPEEAANAKTKIHFIDVGQGSATLIEQNGSFCLIDAGLKASSADLIGYLRDAGVKRLELLVMTHPHADHIGGMVEVLEAFEVEQVLLPDFSKAPTPDSYTALRTLELIDLQGIPEATAKVGDTYALGDGLLTVLDDGVASEDYNDISIITLFEAVGVRFLSAGDAERKQQNRMLENDLVPKIDLYGAAHHGAQDGNGQAWVKSLAPKGVVVSCGKDNSYGHPHNSALQAFARVGAQVYRTDAQGNVLAYVNESGALRAFSKSNGSDMLAAG